MKQSLFIETYDNILLLTNKTIEKTVARTEAFIKIFEKEKIRLVVKPCYFYNQRFHTNSRKKGASVFLRIQLFEEECTFAQAKKSHMYKEFFSHKLIEFTQAKNGFQVVVYACEDAALEAFLNRLLSKADSFKKKGMSAKNVLKENVGDIFRSFVFINRYRTEVKTTLYDFDLHWIILALVIILILLRVNAHHKLIFNAG